MHRFWPYAIALTLLAYTIPVWADINPFQEQFALSNQRSVVLKQLIPGTQDYYYYHCLYYQQQDQLDKVDELLKRWHARHQYDTTRQKEVENRQALLRYSTQPLEALRYLIKELGISHNHQRSGTDSKRKLSSRLPARSINTQILFQQALQYSQYSLYRFTNAALYDLASAKLSADQRRKYLQRLSHPAIPGLVNLIHEDLQHTYSGGFGSLSIHNKLTLKQLDELLKLQPGLRDQTRFVETYIKKLHPNPDQEWENSPAHKAAYLQKLWSFVGQLGPSFNSLKLHVLYHQLQHDLQQGQYNQQRFIEYIQLPRYASYINDEYVRSQSHQSHVGNLYTSYKHMTLLANINNDESLVRQYLAHFFKTEEAYKSYEVYLKESYLKALFAETKLLHGLGDAEKWYGLLSPSELKNLKERVALNFVPTNKKTFAPQEEVSLSLDIKNVKNLLVKVYTINALNYYRKYKSEVLANLNLDGLVANQEQVYTYTEPPIRQFQKTFTFAGLSEGIYIIDFIGNGKNSRALIRKGQLRFVQRQSIAGHVLTILNQTGKPLPQAFVWLDNHKYTADEHGQLTIPYTKQPRSQTIILGHGSFVSLGRFYHRQESYQFHGSLFVDRESLLRHKKATALVRSKLLVNGVPAPLSLLQNVTLHMTATDRFGVKTTHKETNFALKEDQESTYTFRVPENLSLLHLQLTAEVKNVSTNQTQHVSAQQSFAVNQIDKGNTLAGFTLALVRGNYVVDLRDRTGLPWPHRVVYVQMQHRYFSNLINQTLQTNQQGRVFLGSLPMISSLRVRTTQGIQRDWQLSESMVNIPTVVHGKVGDTLTLPYPGKAKQVSSRELALLEKRGGEYVADHASALRIRDGLVLLQDLPAGDYELYYRQLNKFVTVRLTDGDKQGEFLLGKHRILQVADSKPLQIKKISVDPKQLTVALTHTSPWTRVHVIATRYLPLFHPFTHLQTAALASPIWQIWPPAFSHYLVGRSIGEEYRYILERKYAQKYPGNMLKRPSLLLNPWAIRTTQTETQTAQSGEGFGGLGTSGYGRGGGGYGWGGKSGMGYGRYAYQLPNLDYLPESSSLVLNLKPNAKGIVRVPRSALGGHSLIQVVAVTPDHTAYQRISISETPLQPEDLRLRANLPANQHYTQQSHTSKIATNETFALSDLTTSRFEIFDSLDRVYTLFSTLNPHTHLQTFRFLLKWPTLSLQEKKKLYSEHACHELHFFLYKKDHDFFKQVVLPYLANKKDKTFLDQWLIQADLSEYLRPHAYSQLNMVERILLGQRLADMQATTARHILELFEMLSPNPVELRNQFETALLLGALETKGRFAQLRDMTIEHSKLKEKSAKLDDAEAKPAASAPPPPPAAAAEEAPAPKKAYRYFRSRRTRNGDRDESKKEAEADDERGRYDKFAKDLQQRQQIRQYYQALDKTQEWVENNYYKLPISSQNASLVQVNAFWKDYAAHTGNAAFTSTHFTQATRNFTEMMFALSVLDLPFQAPNHVITTKQSSVSIKAAGDFVVFYKAIQETQAPTTKTPILVSQNFYDQSQPYQYIRGTRVERYVTDEFLVRKIYGCQVVVTNPTGTRQKLELLYQIPQGSMPVTNGRYTYTQTLELGAYRTSRFNYFFYFPKSGRFQHFPVHVASQGKLLAFATPKPVKVVNQPSKVDKESWDYISQYGSLQQVLGYLDQNNLQRIPLYRIAWRMKQQTSFQQVIAFLRKHHTYNQALWGYGFLHNDVQTMQDVLQHPSSFRNRLGLAIQSPLLTLDPIQEKQYEHMEYAPLVNARAHALGQTHKILNNRFNQQYQNYLKVMSYYKTPASTDLLAGVYYLLLQDRIAEATELFARVEPDKLKTRLQYDYFKIYLAMYQGDLKTARALASPYQNYPVLRWQQKFVDALNQLDEIEGKSTKTKTTDPQDREQKQTQLASTEASFHFQIKDKNIVISHQNVREFRIHYYLMDIELLFSRSPFMQKHSDQFSYIRPNQVQTIKAGKEQTTVQLPTNLHNSNVMVEITAAGLQRTAAYYSNSLDVQVIENYGQLKVTTGHPAKALSQVYVKVYARLKDHSVVFYKDGYTDRRGRFDYTSLSTNTLDQVSRFSILVLSPDFGAVVREAAPPKQ